MVDVSSKCNYHHTRILTLACSDGIGIDVDSEKRAEARQIIQLWLDEVALPGRLRHATTIALVIASHAVVVMLQVRMGSNACV